MANRNTAIRGLQIRDAFFGDGIKRNGADGDIAEVALKSSGGLKIDTAEIAVEPNDFAGNGLADDGSDNLKLDINGLSDTAIDVANDFLAFDDATDSESKKESIVDFISAIAGDGLSEDSDGVLDVEVDDTTIEINADALRVKDEGITVAKIAINNAEQDGYVLTWNDSGYMEWTAKTAVGEDVVTESEINKENESANCDGIETDFTLSNSPVANSVQVYLNGLLQEEGSGKDYTLSGTTVSFAEAPETNDILIIYYIAT